MKRAAWFCAAEARLRASKRGKIRAGEDYSPRTDNHLP
jgi:hypothetical protein